MSYATKTLAGMRNAPPGKISKECALLAEKFRGVRNKPCSQMNVPHDQQAPQQQNHNHHQQSGNNHIRKLFPFPTPNKLTSFWCVMSSVQFIPRVQEHPDSPVCRLPPTTLVDPVNTHALVDYSPYFENEINRQEASPLLAQPLWL